MLGVWKNSILRFYWLNAKWNFGFWLNAKPCYEERKYQYVSDHFDLNKNLDNLKVQGELDRKTGSQNRFKGYLYKGGLYMDNPGVQGTVDEETRKHWLKKRWI